MGNFAHTDFWAKTADEQITEAKAKSEQLFETEKVCVQKYRVGNLQRLKALEEIATVPEMDSHHRYITHNSFNAFSWIDFFCARFPVFQECYVTSYNFGEAPIDALFVLYDDAVFQSLSIVISESIRYRMPKRFEQLRDGVTRRASPNLRMAGIWNHSKIILLKPAGNEDYFVIEGSGNFSENAYIEQYSVDNSKVIYNFHRHWLEQYVFNPDTIQKKRHFIVGA